MKEIIPDTSARELLAKMLQNTRERFSKDTGTGIDAKVSVTLADMDTAVPALSSIDRMHILTTMVLQDKSSFTKDHLATVPRFLTLQQLETFPSEVQTATHQTREAMRTAIENHLEGDLHLRWTQPNVVAEYMGKHHPGAWTSLSEQQRDDLSSQLSLESLAHSIERSNWQFVVLDNPKELGVWTFGE